MRKWTALFFVLAIAGQAFGYGDEGHETVGAVADGILKGKPVESKVQAMLGGMTLQDVAVLPDKIKTYWDKNKVFHLAGHAELEAELRDFWAANQTEAPNGEKLHHVFHYTDVAITVDHPAYVDGAVGTSPYDIVHMIPLCINVLNGKVPEDNPRKISKKVAVILLAHYVGDIHQPLHVGAAYFGTNGLPIAPGKGVEYFDDRGGNDITALIGGKQVDLHGYWDTDTVLRAFVTKPKQLNQDAIKDMAAHEPLNWKPAAGSEPTAWAMVWADEILPIAKEAHDRLKFEETEGSAQKFKATEIVNQGAKGYDDWAAGVVKEEIHKAGWRLAYLLEQTVQ